MLDMRSPGILWNVIWGIQVAALFVWDQKWGVVMGLLLGGLLGHSLH